MGEQNLPGLAGQGLGGGLDILCPKEAGDHGDAAAPDPFNWARLLGPMPPMATAGMETEAQMPPAPLA